MYVLKPFNVVYVIKFLDWNVGTVQLGGRVRVRHADSPTYIAGAHLVSAVQW